MTNWKQIQSLVPQPGADPDFAACLAAFPQLEQAKTTPQDPVYHAEGDVWTHTQMVVRELLADPGHAALTATERETVFLSLIHI